MLLIADMKITKLKKKMPYSALQKKHFCEEKTTKKKVSCKAEMALAEMTKTELPQMSHKSSRVLWANFDSVW